MLMRAKINCMKNIMSFSLLGISPGGPAPANYLKTRPPGKYLLRNKNQLSRLATLTMHSNFYLLMYILLKSLVVNVFSREIAKM